MGLSAHRSIGGAVAGATLAACAAWSTAFALPAPASFAAATELHALKVVGRGSLRWLGFRMYAATLWSTSGRYDGAGTQEPVALSLAYQHGFSRADLIKITAGEWTRLALADAPTIARWSVELEHVWPDVEPGDVLTALALPGGATEFFGAARSLGRIEDPAFGPAYLAIWLDPRTRLSPLRAELIGTGRAQ